MLAPLLFCLCLLVGAPGAAYADRPAAGSAGPSQRAQGLPSKQVWLRDVSRAMEGSWSYLGRRAEARRPGERLAVVLDIDNTSIATEYAWPRPVKKVLAFARRADRLGVTVYFATGRTKGQLGDTPQVLRDAGYRFRAVCVRHSPQQSLVAGKVRCRKSFERRGYTIIAVIGNRRTDMRGGHLERSFKLPSYGRLS